METGIKLLFLSELTEGGIRNIIQDTLMKTIGRKRTVKSIHSTRSLAGHEHRLDEEYL